jgi:hypothetical protein
MIEYPGGYVWQYSKLLNKCPSRTFLAVSAYTASSAKIQGDGKLNENINLIDIITIKIDIK